jgi:hypothetical protein
MRFLLLFPIVAGWLAPARSAAPMATMRDKAARRLSVLRKVSLSRTAPVCRLRNINASLTIKL